MPYIDVPDAFQIEFPDSWGSTSVDGREYTLSSSDDSELRIDIVAYRAKKNPPPEVRAADVREWAKGMGMQDPGSLSVLTGGATTPRAFASIRGDRRDVFVGFFYFKKSFVVAAGSAPSGDSGGFMRVEELLRSIEEA